LLAIQGSTVCMYIYMHTYISEPGSRFKLPEADSRAGLVRVWAPLQSIKLGSSPRRYSSLYSIALVKDDADDDSWLQWCCVLCCKVFYAGRSFTAIPAKRNVKQHQKDEQRLQSLLLNKRADGSSMVAMRSQGQLDAQRLLKLEQGGAAAASSPAQRHTASGVTFLSRTADRLKPLLAAPRQANELWVNWLYWFKTFTVFWMLFAFFWVVRRRLLFECRRFGRQRLFHVRRRVGTTWIVFVV
jgi:hypothetical protein